jgi:hypothetical protein
MGLASLTTLAFVAARPVSHCLAASKANAFPNDNENCRRLASWENHTVWDWSPRECSHRTGTFWTLDRV